MAIVSVRAKPELDPRRWTALFFIAVAQLMVVLDTTVVNIAIPSAQADLAMSDNSRQWIIAAYTLAFGGLLLFGGRVADLVGRKRTFLAGLAGFAVASAIGGAAVNGDMLIVARTMQGVFGALLSPAALAMVTVAFTEATERGKAFGVYNAVAGGGAAAGLILGGVVTEYLNWRWAFYLSIPIAVIAGVGAMVVVRESVESGHRSRLDIPGVLLSSSGLVLLVLAFASAESSGWTAGVTVELFVSATALLTAFTVVQSKVKAPLLPLRLVAERNRGGVYLALGLAVMTMFAMFLFMTYYLQAVKGYSPVVTGLGFLPMVGGLVIGSIFFGGRLLPVVAPRVLMSAGFVVAVIGLLLVTRLQVDSSYATLVLPAGVLFGLGLGTAFVPAMSLGTVGVEPRDTGVASAMVNAVQEIGGSIGTVLLNSVAAGTAAAYISTHPAAGTSPGQLDEIKRTAMVQGFTTAIWWAIGILLLAALITVALVNSEASRERGGSPAPR